MRFVFFGFPIVGEHILMPDPEVTQVEDKHNDDGIEDVVGIKREYHAHTFAKEYDDAGRKKKDADTQDAVAQPVQVDAFPVRKMCFNFSLVLKGMAVGEDGIG